MRFRLLASASLFLLSYSQESPSFEERHRRDLATNPPDIAFTLSTKDGQTTFHPGEAIPIRLEFSSSSPGKYELDGALYDRSGRLPNEEFVVERADVADPFREYFGPGIMLLVMGGLRGIYTLDFQPNQIDLYLNDWFRFDKPGTYRLYLKSHRLTQERPPSEPGDGRMIPVAPVSNILTIQISESDPAWEATKLAELGAILETTSRDDSTQAKRELRYLGTPGAIRLIFERARRNSEDLDSFGLIGSPNRDLVVDQLDQFIADPEIGINSWMIHLRTLFEYVREKSLEPIPMYTWQVPGGDWDRIASKVEPELDARREQFERMLRRRAIDALPLMIHKSPEAREESEQTILSIVPDEARAAGLKALDDFDMPNPQLIASFQQFSEKRQLILLTRKWDLIRGPEILPALRHLVREAPSGSLPRSNTPYLIWHGASNIHENALERLLQIAPDEGRQILRQDIASAGPRFPYLAVSELPTQAIPEADAAFTEGLKSNPVGAMPLVAKFGSTALSLLVRSVYSERKWPCDEETWFVAYFLRVLPPPEARKILTTAMDNREDRGCFRSLLGGIANTIWNPILESEAISRLDDSDPETAANSARVLAHNGGASVEAFLWKRLELWFQKWINREPDEAESRLGTALFESISKGQAWYLDTARSRRLASLCLDSDCRKRWTSERSEPVRVSASNGSPIYGKSFNVGQYHLPTLDLLKEKLHQFPAGTNFRWCPPVEMPMDVFTPDERNEMYLDIARFLAARAMRIEPYSKESCEP